ncbi:hypothetical protein B7P43_G04154 [Cryptotermes secundus]|uniref:JmjC domain-containing protein n=1 Tax=Cryptotermes secundus TaxID=105785 RepID=A0A2J7QXQ0_9NEOP|nr:HSPB1-associated protein 1 isoform X3 [Cryptotermes secundus]PNF33363.1 hypothetical protein B7P43_G04154 [Cryptotermes secundus]PNF33365.1 hypothetical protein B7P43_G04154 [Cryptotermes secundus]
MAAVELPPSALMRHMILEGFKMPVVFNGFIEDWEILSWSLDTWAEKFGDKVLPFRSGFGKSTKVPQWEGLCERINLTLKEFVKLERIVEKKEENTSNDNSTRWMYFDYKYMNEWFSDQQSLLNAVTWKNFGFPERGGSLSTIWIGNDGAHTPCHLDTYGCNLVAQVYELQEAYVVTLKPGDVLFVPHYWWHYVENVGTAVSINSWIPLLSDDEYRLEEALVRFFVSQVCKNLPENKLNQLLNPNEADLVDHPLSTAAQQVEICLERCHQNRACGKELDVNVDSQSMKKRSRLDGESDLYVCGQTSNKLTQEEVLYKYKDIISVVPKYSVSEFRSLLMEKQKSFPAQNMGGISSGVADADMNRLQDIVNAFCHPEIISKIKDKILMQV